MWRLSQHYSVSWRLQDNPFPCYVLPLLRLRFLRCPKPHLVPADAWKKQNTSLSPLTSVCWRDRIMAQNSTNVLFIKTLLDSQSVYGCNVFQTKRYLHYWKYRISRPIRRTFFPEKCLNSTCVLCAEGKYYFETYKYPYIHYTTSLSWDSEISFQIMRSGITACERLTFLSGDLP